MNKVQSALGGIVLAGVVGFTSVVPAAAAPAGEGASTGPSTTAVAAAPMAAKAPMAGKADRVKRLGKLTVKGQASLDAWFAGLGQYRQGKNPYAFDWSTDGCSKAPEKIPGGYDFTFPCHRHDFGYRNYKSLVGVSKFRSQHKKRIDAVFLQDMKQVCGRFFWADPLTPAARKKAKASCLKTADKYYATVRALG
ncbi:phospholipase [Streptomyces kanasensis]|uniref:phospholipase n=1 Tax=Streptomyces kanasensis TaxID=936756 RepID=UPI0037FD0A8E